MKPKNPLKAAFFQTASNLMVGILTVTNMPKFVQAQVSNAVIGQHAQAQVLAQFSQDQSQDREPKAYDQLVQRANALFQGGDLTGAEKNLRVLIKKFPEDSYGHFQLGNVLFHQGKKEDAIIEYQKAIRLDSKYALAHNAIGLVYASQQQWEPAIAEYRKALAINPDYGDALTNLALTLWQQGKRDEAIASLQKALNVFKGQQRTDKVRQIEQMLQQIKTGNDPTVS